MLVNTEIYRSYDVLPTTFADDKTGDDIDFDAMMEALLSPPSVESFQTDENAFDHIVHFIANYVVKLYGLYALQAKVRNNPGSTFIDHTTLSDWAYCLLLVVNGKARVDQLIEIKTFNDDVQAMYKMKRDKMTQAERDMYPIVQGLFTGRKGNKLIYRGHGMNAEGLALYETIKAKWAMLFRNKVWYGMLKEKWYEYVKESGIGKHWKSIQLDSVDGCALGGIPQEEQQAALLCLPGDADFEDDSPWRTMNIEEDEVEDEDDSDAGAVEDGNVPVKEMLAIQNIHGSSVRVPSRKSPSYGTKQVDAICEAGAASNSKRDKRRERAPQNTTSTKKSAVDPKKRKKPSKILYGGDEDSSSDEERSHVAKMNRVSFNWEYNVVMLRRIVCSVCDLF